MPVFFLQAENDHDLTPNRVLSEGRPESRQKESLSCLRFRSPRGSQFLCTRHGDLGPDVLRFIETHLKIGRSLPVHRFSL
jgi:hypothetical protein